jgi:hypothetical protein
LTLAQRSAAAALGIMGAGPGERKRIQGAAAIARPAHRLAERRLWRGRCGGRFRQAVRILLPDHPIDD